MSAGCITVKGVGEFRVVDTGAEKTVAYLPDTELAQEVNSPFSLFEPVNLSEGVTEAMLDETDESEKAGTDSEGSAVVPETNESSVAPARDDVDVEVTDNLSDIPVDNPAELPPGLPPVPGATEISVEIADEEPAAHPGVGEPKSTVITGQPEESSAAKIPVNSGTTEEKKSVENLIPEFPAHVIPEKDESEEVPRERRPRWRRKETVIIVLIGLLSLLAGVLAGHFGIPGLNINGVKSVKITAEEVTLLHEKPSKNDLTAGMPGAKDTVSSKDNFPDTDTVEVAPTAVDAEADRPVAPPVVTDTVQGTNYLSRIARRHYGKDIFWVYIYEENKDKIQDPNNINPGTVVVIPPAEKYGIDPSNSASIHNAERLSAKILNKES